MLPESFLVLGVFGDGEVFGFEVFFLCSMWEVVIILGIIEVLGILLIREPFRVLQWLRGGFRVAEVLRGIYFPNAYNGFPFLVGLRSLALFPTF